MIDPKTNPGSEEHESIERLRPGGRAPGSQPARLPVRPDQRAEVPQAARRDRRDRPGDGQPDRPSRGMGHRQALRGGPRLPESPLQRGQRGLQPEARGGCPLREAVRSHAGSRPGSRRHDRLQGRVQPHVPGPAGPGRHRPGAGAQLSDPHSRHRAGLGQRDLAGRPGLAVLPHQHRPGLREPLPQAQDPGPQLPAQPDGHRRRARRSSRRSSAWPASTASS